MQIEWFTFVAQLVNFFVLVWLLKRFLYKPILEAIDERERLISTQLKNAQEREAEATYEKTELQKKNEQFEQDKKRLMEKTIAEINNQRDRLIEEARNDATDLREKLEISLIELQEQKKEALMQKTIQEVFALAKTTLQSLASVRLEEFIVAEFIEKVSNLDTQEQREFIEALSANFNSISVCSAFELSEKQKSELKQAFYTLLNVDVVVEFSIKPDVICGIELTSNGFKLAWNITDYVGSFERKILEGKRTN